ncbi:efflux RND transporter periplasmic adaptor subunit [Rhodanobacter sp. MP7CTX1]|jgi:membrane fusion protein, multidrug efflux system|uniref:efflux RND transporter periplasmic adaptor subunit n=1 Tax=Rhodanobacter sp. MP7CTX1 TaxID=2723084 RepID=UPI001615B7B6|nr:efflux RND transporter periplasmic adaptor subunit [Rhodanobacter sp. MP7CTX1]MBB6188962.1 membrane fusion protein (multidrug efflux system) [Rhodanobacter sp. MP7CTX1]
MKSSLLRTPVLCLSLLALAACGKKPEPPQPPPPQVGVITARQQSAPLTRDTSGRLSAYYSANVTARVSGVLLKRNYTEGSAVKQGQLLFEIDPTFYQAQLNNSLSILAQDQATQVNARVTVDRDHKLVPNGYVSQQQVDNDEAVMRSAIAKVKADEANVASARVNLGYTKVTSPIDGIAGQQQVTAGATVGNGTSDVGSGGTLLTTVQQIDQLYANFTISAADLAMLQQAQSKGSVALTAQNKTTVQIIQADGSKYEPLGTLDFSDVTVNANTGAVNLRALVPNPNHQLLAGLYVTLTVNLGQLNNVFLIPQQALLRDSVGAYALVVGKDDKVVRKDVNASNSYESNWIVTSGLSNGDQVIVTGLQGAKEGGSAKATPWQPAQAAATQAGSDAKAPAGQSAGNKQ